MNLTILLSIVRTSIYCHLLLSLKLIEKSKELLVSFANPGPIVAGISLPVAVMSIVVSTTLNGLDDT